MWWGKIKRSNREKKLHKGAYRTESGRSQMSTACKAKGRFKTTDLIISGDFEGELITSELLTTTENSVIQGRVVVHDAVIGGRLYGEILAKGQLTLLSSAIVEGSIACEALQIDLGASFDGVCFTSDPKVRLLKHT